MLVPAPLVAPRDEESLLAAPSRDGYERLVEEPQAALKDLGKTFLKLKHKKRILEFLDVLTDVAQGCVLIYEKSEFMAADIYTKGFTDPDKWEHARHLINVVDQLDELHLCHPMMNKEHDSSDELDQAQQRAPVGRATT